MAFNPQQVVQESVTEDNTTASRIYTAQGSTPYHTIKAVPYQYSPPGMARTSISPTKASVVGDFSRPSPRARNQKEVTFELLLPTTQSRARLPMRVMISSHDNTDSIIATVKNFYGLYEGGVSFLDRHNNIMIAAYDNFDDGMTVFVKVSDDLPLLASNEVPTPVTSSPKKPKLGPPFEMRPPAHHRLSGYQSANRSPSPSSTGKSRSRSSKSQDHGTIADTFGEYSDSDGGNASVSSSKRSRGDAHASAEISVDNILEGGRRKRAKFESCELPLFVPPQVPVTTSLSSVSPQRRMNGEMASPLPLSNQRTFAYNQPLPSPQSFGRSDLSYNIGGQSSAQPGQRDYGPAGHQLRGRPAISYQPPRRSNGGILPTPEPTVGSVISDEDVALQLMRLGDASNMSHGRTSTSTVDDALSGKAEAASSEEESDEDEEELALPGPRYPLKDSPEMGPRRKKQRTASAPVESESSEEEYDDSFRGDSDDIMPDGEYDGSFRRSSKAQLPSKPFSSNGTTKDGKTKSSKSKTKPSTEGGHSHKASVSSVAVQLGPDEEDLSSRPRCQRCRKSKKGCDRQRPCGRCKDAGIGIEGCISEDEGNGRRGRYGRHMGVVIKKMTEDSPSVGALSPIDAMGATFLTPALPIDKIKKRKRST